MKPVFLIGFMGCGKTTLGSALAEATGREFVDLDHCIEAHCGCSVTEIFAERGEAGFRELESAMLSRVARMENVIVACGGGTPCFGLNMNLMNRSGLTVWLNAGHEVLLRRLLEAQASRPLIAGKPADELSRFIDESLERRRPYYSRAAATFPSDELENRQEIDRSVARFIEQFMS